MLRCFDVAISRHLPETYIHNDSHKYILMQSERRSPVKLTRTKRGKRCTENGLVMGSYTSPTLSWIINLPLWFNFHPSFLPSPS